jgi:hypothetical protein
MLNERNIHVSVDAVLGVPDIVGQQSHRLIVGNPPLKILPVNYEMADADGRVSSHIVINLQPFAFPFGDEFQTPVARDHAA